MRILVEFLSFVLLLIWILIPCVAAVLASSEPQQQQQQQLPFCDEDKIKQTNRNAG